jgi:transcriptional regulator with XRE-family HTH domain
MTRLQVVFIENLKLARKNADLTQESLAEKAGVTSKHVSAIERGIKFPPLQLIEALANALGIAPYELFLDPSGIPGTSPEGIIKSYNRYLEGKLSDDLQQAGDDFLKMIDEKSIED